MSVPPYSNRRQSIRLIAGSVVGATTAAAAPNLAAIEPFNRPGSPRLQLSLAAYSFRKFFGWMRGKAQLPAAPDRALTMSSFITLAADLGFDAAELTSYFFNPAILDQGLPALRRQAFLRGISLSGTAVGNNFALAKAADRDREIANVKRWIDRAALLGIPHIRVFAGPVPRELTPHEAQRLCIESLEVCAAYAGTRGVMIGLENHGGLVTTADQLLDIVQAVKSEWFGISLDTGNFHSDEIYNDLARCAPYAVNVQYKVEIRRRKGAAAEPADPHRVIALLRNAGYEGFLALEYEAAEDPYLAVPKHLRKLREALGSW